MQIDVNEYVGLPFDRRAFHCWNLIQRFYRERKGIELPEFDFSTATTDIDFERERWSEIQRGQEAPGDVALFRESVAEFHVALVVGDRRMLHVRIGGLSNVERYDTIEWKRKLAGFYRYAPDESGAQANAVARCGAIEGPGDQFPAIFDDAPQGAYFARFYPMPFSARPVDVILPVDTSIERAIYRYAPRGLDLGFTVTLNGLEVSPSDIADAFPHEGQMLQVAVVPGGAPDKLIQSLGPIGVLLTSRYLGGLIGGGLGLIVTAGLSALGMWGISSLIPAPEPKLDPAISEGPNFTVTGSNNQANLYGPIPRLFGTHRIFPPLAAESVIERVGRDVYVRMLFCIYGPCNFYDFKIGETDAENYDAEIEVATGAAGDMTVSMFPTSIDSETVNINITTAWREITTAPDSDEFQMDIVWPLGLYERLYAGGKGEATVYFRAQYRDAGSADTWLPTGDPTDEDTAAPLDEWNLSGDASYAAGEIDIGNGGAYGKATSPKMLVNYSPEAFAQFNFYGYGASPTARTHVTFHRPYRRTADGDEGGPTVNDDGNAYQSFYDDVTIGAWGTESNSVTCGSRVRWVRIVIDNDATPGEHFKFKEPKLARKETFTVTASTTSLLARTVRWVFAANGQYDVRVKRDNEAGAQTPYGGIEGAYNVSIDECYIETHRSIEYTNPIQLEGLALIALRLKLTDQMSSPPSNFNCIGKALFEVWNGSSWDAAIETSNPAWHFAHLLKHEHGKTVADARIDLAEMIDFASFCSSYGYTFDFVFDRRTTVREAATTIVAAGRGAISEIDGKYSVVWDTYRTNVAAHFTDRNVRTFSVERVMYDVPHALKVRFKNSEQGYREDVCHVYNDGYDENNATIIEQVEFPGAVTYTLVFKHGRYRIADMKLRRETYMIGSDFEALRLTRGDLIRTGSDVTMWGLWHGRATAVVINGTEVTITIDEEMTFEMSTAYTVRFRYSDGESVAITFNPDAGTTHDIVIDPFPPIIDKPAVNDLASVGYANTETTPLLVRTAIPDAQQNVMLQCVDYDEGVYTAEFEEMPEFNTNISLPPPSTRKPPKPIIISARSDEYVLYRGSDGSLQPRILLDIAFASGGDVPAVHVQAFYRETGSGQKWISLPVVDANVSEISILSVTEGTAYDIRIWSISEAGNTSDWATLEDHTVIGKTSLPADITNLYLRPDNILYWSYTPPVDFRGFKIRYNAGEDTSWDTGTPAHDGYMLASTFYIGSFTVGTTTWLVKAYDTSDNESANAVTLTKDLGDPSEANVIAQIDYEAEAFPGEIDDGGVDGGTGELWADEETSLFYHGDETLFYDRGTLFYGSTYKAMTYTFPFLPEPDDAGADLWFDKTTTQERDCMYRASKPDNEDDFNRAALGADWTVVSGTWVIDANRCKGTCTTGDDYLTWTNTVTLGTKTYIYVKVTQSSGRDYGLRLCGRIFRTKSTGEWQLDKGAGVVDADNQPALTDHWLFEILEDETINWYAVQSDATAPLEEFYLDSTSPLSTNNGIQFYTGTATNVTFWDDIKMWEPGGTWVPWPGKVTTDDDEMYEFRVRTLGGATRGKVTELVSNLDLEDVIEYQNDISIAAASTRLTLVKTYRAITHITLTVQASGAETATSAKALDKQATAGAGNGPDIQCYNAAGTTAGHIDARIRGY